MAGSTLDSETPCDLPNRGHLPPVSMRFEIHQYYGTFGFSLAIVTEKTYNEF